MKALALVFLLTGCALVETRDDVKVHAEHVTITINWEVTNEILGTRN